MAIIGLRPGQVVYSEAGKFLFSSGDVVMETKLTAPTAPTAPVSPTPAAGGFRGPAGGSPPSGFGGLLRGTMDVGKRVLAGESFAFNHFSTPGGDGLLALAGVLPGEMRTLELDGRTTWYAEKDAFVAAEAGVHFDIAFSGYSAVIAGLGEADADEADRRA